MLIVSNVSVFSSALTFFDSLNSDFLPNSSKSNLRSKRRETLTQQTAKLASLADVTAVPAGEPAAMMVRLQHFGVSISGSPYSLRHFYLNLLVLWGRVSVLDADTLRWVTHLSSAGSREPRPWPLLPSSLLAAQLAPYSPSRPQWGVPSGRSQDLVTLSSSGLRRHFPCGRLPGTPKAGQSTPSKSSHWTLLQNFRMYHLWFSVGLHLTESSTRILKMSSLELHFLTLQISGSRQTLNKYVSCEWIYGKLIKSSEISVSLFSAREKLDGSILCKFWTFRDHVFGGSGLGFRNDH